MWMDFVPDTEYRRERAVETAGLRVCGTNGKGERMQVLGATWRAPLVEAYAMVVSCHAGTNECDGTNGEGTACLLAHSEGDPALHS